MRAFGRLLVAVVFFLGCRWAGAQQTEEFSRKNTWTLFGEYSPDSSHILMGQSRHRILADFGGAYARRLWRFKESDFSYLAEVRPVLFESDPVMISNVTYTFAAPVPYGPQTYTSSAMSAIVPPCKPSITSYTIPPGLFPEETIVVDNTCGRQWTFGQAYQPVGFKYSLRTRHPLQPFLAGTLGYMYTSRPVPVADAEAFNFVFDVGAGVELYRTQKRSVSLECRYHHFSNKNTAEANPGTDNLMFKASYSFGR